MTVCMALLVCNLAFIWVNSVMPATVSAAFSRWVMELLGKSSSGGGSDAGDGLLRKVAHFAEFCSLGVLLSWLFAMLKERKQTVVLLAAACGCSAACVDEMLQYLAPGRAPRLTDVGIDTAGVLAGIGICSLGYYIVKKYHLLNFGGKQP